MPYSIGLPEETLPRQRPRRLMLRQRKTEDNGNIWQPTTPCLRTVNTRFHWAILTALRRLQLYPYCRLYKYLR